MKKLCSVLLILVLLVSCLSGLCFAADPECAYTPAGGETMEGTLKEAAAALTAKGGTIKLLRDVDYTDDKANHAVSVQSSITFDLNGHVFRGLRMLHVEGKGVVDVTHILDSVGGGASICAYMNINIAAGGLRMENVVCWSDKQQNVSIYDTTGMYNDRNLITGCVLANGGWGALSFNNSKASQEKCAVKVENSTLANLKNGGAVVKQGKAVTATIEFGDNVTLMDVKGGGTGVATGILIKGQKPVKQEGTTTLTVLDKTAENLFAWKTGGEAKPVSANPLDRVTPYAPSVSADPKPEQQPYAPDETPVEETPVSQPVQDLVTIPAKNTDWLDTLSLGLSLASAVMNLVVIILIMKKQKKD